MCDHTWLKMPVTCFHILTKSLGGLKKYSKLEKYPLSILMVSHCLLASIVERSDATTD